MNKKILLKDVVNIDSGFAFKSSLFTDDKKYIPIIRIRDVNSGIVGTYYSGEYDDKYVVNNGDLLISMDGSFVVKKWNGGKALLNQRVCRIKSVSQEITDDYIFRILPKELKIIEDKTSFVTVKHLSVTKIENIEINLPDLKTQKKIVEALDKAQELIDKRKEQIETLDELVKSRLIELFGNLYTNDKNWDESIISGYCQVKGGKRLPKGERLLDEQTEHPYLRVLDLKNSTVLEDDIKYLTNEIYEKIKRYTISSEDVYLTNVGEKLGMAGTIPEKFNNANLTENAVKLVFDNNVINRVYLAYYLNSDVCQKYILERKMSVGVPKLAIFRIESLPLILPPIELQNEFANFVNQVDKLKFEMETSLKELEDNFNSLMQRAFKGELFN